MNARRHLSGRALEDQRKFREADQDESYFDSEDDDDDSSSGASSSSVRSVGSGSPSSVPAAIDEVDAQQQQQQHRHNHQGEGGAVGGGDILHRTPRMFSLAQAPLLNSLDGFSDSPFADTDGDRGASS